MIVNNKIIKKIAEYHNVYLEKDFIDYIFQEYGKEPFPHERDEQGLFQGVSKLVEKYKKGSLEFKLLTSEEALKEEIEYLKDLYISNMRELSDVKETLFERTQILIDYSIDFPDSDIDF